MAISGRLFRDCLTHDPDAVPWLVGEPVTGTYASVSTLVDKSFEDTGDVDNAIDKLRFTDGAHAMLPARHDLVYDCCLEVLTSKDTVVVG